MTQNTTDLLPCPFCGNEACIAVSDLGYGVNCNNLNCDMRPKTPIWEKVQQAIKRWNTRASTPTPAATFGELEQAVINAALRWYAADIYVHSVLSREQAVKVGVADLIDAVQNYQNLQQACWVKND